MLKMLRYNLLLLLMVTLSWSFQPSVASAETSAEWQAAVAQQKYLLWQRINEARNNPLQVLKRLEIPLEQAQAVFGEDSAVLTEGLPPLAWSYQLSQAASQHSRDMINHVYYSHTSPDGSGVTERIAATGYQAVSEDETMRALLFLNPVELDRGVSILLDNILRDELTGAGGVSRNIFSSELTEVAVSFQAEIIPALTDYPFVYLVVIDFAQPLTPRRFMVGQFDKGDRLMMMPFATELWGFLPDQLPGLFQVAFPEGGASLVVFREKLHQLSHTMNYYDEGLMDNIYIDFRTE